MNRKLLAVSAVVIAVVLYAAVNILSTVGLRQARVDLTADHLYTLAQGSKNIVAALKEPITLRFYFSEKLSNQVPQIKAYGKRVRELLEEYANRSHGKIHLQVIDPAPYSDAEDQAVQAGMQGVPLDPSSDEQFYFGLVGTNTTDRQETIPFFQQQKEAFLEYDLTKLVYNLTDPKRPVVGLITDLPMEYGPGGIMGAMRGQSQPYALMGQLQQSFDVKVLKPDLTSIADDVRVLLIADAKNLKPPALYAIDQFVLRGGRAVVMVDPWSESEFMQQAQRDGRPDPTAPHTADLPELFKAWGVQFDATHFIADRKLAIQVATSSQGRQTAVDYVAWLALSKQNLDAGDVVTGGLGTINLASAGAVSPLPGATTKFTPLLTSSNQAGPMDVDKVRFMPNPQKLLTELQPTGKTYVLAARITGDAKTAFPDGPPPVPKAADKTAAGDDAGKDAKPAAERPQIKVSATPINVIVVGDSDLLDDRFWVQSQDFMGQHVNIPIAANGDFVINAIDNLAGSGDLIGLRSRGLSQRPFVLIDSMRRNASQQYLAREQALQKSLEETQKKVAELQSKAKAEQGGALLSGEEQQTIEKFRQDILRTRKELRQVQLSLNQDIDRLEWHIKLTDLALVPALVALAAVLLAGLRYRRRRRRAGNA